LTTEHAARLHTAASTTVDTVNVPKLPQNHAD